MSEYNVTLEVKTTCPDMEKNPNGKFEFEKGDVICINGKKVIVKKGNNSSDCPKCIFQGGPPKFNLLEKLALCNSVECRSYRRKDKETVLFKEVEE